MMSIGASCGSATKPPDGSEPNEYSNAVDLLLPDRLAKPDAELLDYQSAPARREKVAQLVDDDEQVKEDDDLEKDEDDAIGRAETWRYENETDVNRAESASLTGGFLRAPSDRRPI